MTPRTQRRLAIGVALVALSLVIAANAQLLSAAFQSQPECVAVEDGAAPAKRAC